MGEMFVHGDESGTDAREGYCVAGGYLASPRNWGRFRKAWWKTLDRESVTDFHSRVFFHRRKKADSRENQFAGWSDRKARAFLRELVGHVQDSGLRPVVGTVENASFFRFTPDERRMLTGGEAAIRSGRVVWTRSGSPNAPYQMAIQMFYVESAERCQPGTKIHFILDRHSTLTTYADDVFRRTQEYLNGSRHAHAGKLGDTIRSTRTDRHNGPGIQVADMLCNLLQAKYIGLDEGRDIALERQLALNVLIRDRYEMPYAEGDFIEVLLRSTRARLGDSASFYAWSPQILTPLP